MRFESTVLRRRPGLSQHPVRCDAVLSSLTPGDDPMVRPHVLQLRQRLHAVSSVSWSSEPKPSSMNRNQMDPAGIALHHVGKRQRPATRKRETAPRRRASPLRAHRYRRRMTSRSESAQSIPLVVPTTRLRLYLPELNVAKELVFGRREDVVQHHAQDELMQRDFTCIFCPTGALPDGWCAHIPPPTFSLFPPTCAGAQRFTPQEPFAPAPTAWAAWAAASCACACLFPLGIKIHGCSLPRQFPLQAADLLVGACYGGGVGLYGLFRASIRSGERRGRHVLRLLFKAGLLQRLLQPLCPRCLLLVPPGAPVQHCRIRRLPLPRPAALRLHAPRFLAAASHFLCLRTHLRQPLVNRRQIPQLAQFVQHLALCGYF